MKINTGDTVTVDGRQYKVTGRTRRSASGANGWLILEGGPTVPPAKAVMPWAWKGISDQQLDAALEALGKAAETAAEAPAHDPEVTIQTRGIRLDLNNAETPFSRPTVVLTAGTLVTIGQGKVVYRYESNAVGKATLRPCDHPNSAKTAKYGVPVENLRAVN